MLIILNRFVIGGQAVDTIPLVHELQKDFNVLILYGEKEKDEIEPSFLLHQYPGLQLKKISHLRRSINPFIDIIAFFRLYFTISKFKAQIVHTHGAKSGFLGRLAAFISGVPVIIHTFHGHFFHSYFSKRISNLVAAVERMAGKITTAAIALSETQKHDLVHVYKVLPENKIRVVPLGFAYPSSENGATLRNNFRQQYGLQEPDIAIGIVGRIVPVKDHFFFLEIVETYMKSYPGSRVAFFVIGDGDLRRQLEARLAEISISYSNSAISDYTRVVFTSWLQDMDMVMTGLDIVVLTSLNEGTPLSMIEAQYFRRPVVCTNVGGVKDTMVDGETGYLVENRNTASFVEKLHRLVESEQLRSAMGEAAHAFVLQKFSKTNEVNITKEFYLSLLHQKLPTTKTVEAEKQL
nr:glycosyltransferase [Aridibaculum aurantiacum]